jgi:hypothetical protein
MNNGVTHLKKVYIASKLNSMEETVQRLKAELELRGYEIPYDWTLHPISKPYSSHANEAHTAADNMIRAIMSCDILVVLCAPNGLGLHIETGGALVAGGIQAYISERQQKRIYVVGEHNDRSVFYFHTSVTRIPDIPALLTVLPPLS